MSHGNIHEVSWVSNVKLSNKCAEFYLSGNITQFRQIVSCISSIPKLCVRFANNRAVILIVIFSSVNVLIGEIKG